ncbi:MAG: Uma2 family endonuclease [Microcystis sp. M54BS1]|uniref:Uma2 family endonuclease n=1 Tax=unclassified Microcystis TaxID=2643300 RepID=UPI001DF8D2F2|nr:MULTISPECIES: Uma2 family endonuclease [unclassified Microcystis]MBE5231925.1 Uma2 family endonuclease [Microcystis aeruginosa PMC 728.11]MCA2542093.1 Uma2 family endonuclease [Microcystis sp. M54BS1]MCA2595495.1 Uma2 family endonuclease [Microcystis sp. M38BS1]MCA2609830.1 Uma2 family endonuclease [Microcystis sp. M27BS1]MCA2507192.1 Uma2 family endonuclease [Microcystis sp. M62BS1]
MTTPSFTIPQSDPPLSPRQSLPTMYDLPSDNPLEPGLPDEFHLLQPQLLLLTFQPPNWEPDLVFSAADLNLYYNVRHPQWYKRPDWFGVVGVPRLYDGHDLRLSYVIWQEGVSPTIVVELLSPGTENQDLGQELRQPGEPPTKWTVYEQILRIPYYVVFSRYTNQLQAFELVGGYYQPVALVEGRLPIPPLELSLGLWQGSYRGIERLWLRWLTLEGELIPLADEELIAAKQEASAAKQEASAAKQEASAAKQEASAAKQRAEQLAARLRELGIDTEA